MALPVTIPNAFANATASIPLSQLDANFNTLANAVNGISDGSETLANVTATVGNITTVNATTVDTTNIEVTNIKAKDGTAAVVLTDSTGAVAVSTPLTANGGVVFNDAGADVDFRVEGDTEANLLFVDASADKVGIGTSSPASRLNIAGSDGVGFTITQSGTTTGAADTGGVVVFQNYDGSNLRDAAYIYGRKENATVGNYASYMSFWTRANGVAAAERMRIDSSGNVDLIQSANLTWRFAPASTIRGSISVDSSDVMYFRNGSSNTERARITSGGQVLVGTTSALPSDGRLQSSQSLQSSASISADATNGSFDYHTFATAATRSANSAYSFFNAWSGNYGDVEFKLRGDGNGYADGTWNNNGADYAEFFESASGQALTLGATVVLDGNKVREATSQDPASAIIGVVRPKEPSKASMVVGNTAWNKWANKYLTDDFDRYIMEDHDVVEWEEQVLEHEATEAVEAVVDEEGVEVSPAVPAQEAVYKTVQHSYESHAIPAGVSVPEDATRKTHDDKGNKFQHYKLNPAWNPDSEYVNRENRPEWNIIGLLGQVKILKGQPVGDRWVKMRDISETVEEWMIR